MHFFGISKPFTYNSFWNLIFAQTHEITESTNPWDNWIHKPDMKKKKHFIKSNIADPTNQKVIICLLIQSQIWQINKTFWNKQAKKLYFLYIWNTISNECFFSSWITGFVCSSHLAKTQIPQWGQKNVFPSLPLYSISFPQKYPTSFLQAIQKLPTSILDSKAFQKHYKSCQNRKYYHFRGIFTKEYFYWGSGTIVSRNYSPGTGCTIHCLTCPTACLKVKNNAEQILVLYLQK